MKNMLGYKNPHSFWGSYKVYAVNALEVKINQKQPGKRDVVVYGDFSDLEDLIFEIVRSLRYITVFSPSRVDTADMRLGIDALIDGATAFTSLFCFIIFVVILLHLTINCLLYVVW